MYGNERKPNYIRMWKVMNLPVVKDEIDNQLQRLLIEKGITKEKYLNLLEKAENVAKNTKDYLDISDRIASLTGINDKKEVKTTITQEINYSEMLKSGKNSPMLTKAKQEITSYGSSGAAEIETLVPQSEKNEDLDGNKGVYKNDSTRNSIDMEKTNESDSPVDESTDYKISPNEAAQ